MFAPVSANIDLHTHTNASNGRLSPVELVERAERNNVKVLAITDHDTLSGIPAALGHAEKHGVKLIPGVEVSTLWRGKLIHVVGLNVDLHNQELLQCLANEQDYQVERIDRIGAHLEQEGVDDIRLRAASLSGGASKLNLWHYANILQQDGIEKDIFRSITYCSGIGKKLGFNLSSTCIETAVSLVKNASGISVLAHPFKLKNLTAVKLQELINDFARWGGDAVEVFSGNIDKAKAGLIKKMMKDTPLWVSIGSDFHGNTALEIDVGCTLLYEPGIKDVLGNLETKLGLNENIVINNK